MQSSVNYNISPEGNLNIQRVACFNISMIYTNAKNNRESNAVTIYIFTFSLDYNQMIEEKVLMSTEVEESNVWNKWGSTEQDLMQIY